MNYKYYTSNNNGQDDYGLKYIDNQGYANATNLADKNIRVNAVAPGVFWTPLQPACWEAKKIPTLGSDAPMGRAGHPYEIAPIFVYLASDDSSYTTGQVIHINGGEYKG